MTFYNKNFTIGTDAYCGYFISNHISTGLLTDFSINSSKVSNTLNDSEFTEISNTYSFGPFLRYYTNPGIFFEGSFELGFRHLGSDGNQTKINSYSLRAPRKTIFFDAIVWHNYIKWFSKNLILPPPLFFI